MRNVLFLLLLVIVGFAAFIATRPAAFRIERSATIEAPEDIVYANVSNFHEWAAWSPWDRLDPDMEKLFEGPESGVGASYHWSGNDDAGEGRMTIIDAQPAERVVIQLDFIKPWEASHVTRFELSPVAEGTHVTWTMEGENDFIGKAASVFMNMDQVVGGDFEKGLASLREVAESEATTRPDTAAADSAAVAGV
jgi:uncharacterized protein YndB with AHSA1/START domain